MIYRMNSFNRIEVSMSDLAIKKAQPMKKFLVVSAVAALSATFQVQADDALDAKYQRSCFACHGTGAAGAPKVGDKEAWAPRLALGMDALVASVKKGKGVMPPMGLCQDCTDDDFKALINKMSK
jgi:cytochrome c5